MAAAELGGKVYVVGGLGPSRALLEYDPATGRWRRRAPVPAGLHHTAAVGVRGRLHVVGGYADGCLAPARSGLERPVAVKTSPGVLDPGRPTRVTVQDFTSSKQLVRSPASDSPPVASTALAERFGRGGRARWWQEPARFVSARLTGAARASCWRDCARAPAARSTA